MRPVDPFTGLASLDPATCFRRSRSCSISRNFTKPSATKAASAADCFSLTPPVFRRFRSLVGRPTRSHQRAEILRTIRSVVGVASGDPTDRGVVLWTRLAPKPLEPGGGLDAENVEVTWEIAGDEAMRNVVQPRHDDRHAAARPFGARRGRRPRARSLVLVPLPRRRRREPDRPHAHDAGAPMPIPPKCDSRSLPASTTNTGYYTAYEHMAKDELDLVFHLGDYIYEYKGMEGEERVRKHVGDEIMSLDDYRIRHAQYKSDPLLQAMHARCPWLVVWDDHEFDNDCANDISEEEGIRSGRLSYAPCAQLTRRTTKMMPLRRHVAAARPEHAAVSQDSVRPARRISDARHAPISHRSAQRRQG